MSERGEQRPVSMAVIVHEGRVLMIRRRKREGKLLWAFPGGGIEPRETPEQAAVREVREEVALEVAASRLLGQRMHPETGRTTTYVACEVVAGEARVAAREEVSEIAWIRHAQICDYVPYGLFASVQEHLNEVLPQDPVAEYE